ncbi:hypothetical protein EBU58_10450, partial [bacterium]|nr:hypothetical protein [bacterium]
MLATVRKATDRRHQMTRSLRLRHATHLSAACLLLTCGLPLARATEGISSKDSTASTVTTAAESQPLWSGPALPATAEAPELTDVWCSVIKPYAFTDDGYRALSLGLAAVVA